MITRNYTYGAKSPHINLERVEQQMVLSHRYRNAMVELERWRRGRVAEIQTALLPGLSEAQKNVEKLSLDLESHFKSITDRNVSERKRTGNADDRAKTSVLRGEIKSAREKCKEIKSLDKSELFLGATKELSEENALKSRALREKFVKDGLYWGTYLVTEDNARDSFKRSKGDPNFLKWEGKGCVAVHFQPAIPFQDVLDGKSTILRMEASKDNPKHVIAYLRIGSEAEDRRSAVWSAAKVKLHRPAPAGSIITHAHFERKRIGLTYHWQFRMTIRIPDGIIESNCYPTDDKVGVNLGWRLMDDGLRVAYWVGSDGLEGQLLIPWDRIGQMKHPDVLRGIRDKSFNEIKEALSAWIKVSTIPDWMIEKCKAIHLWKSQGRMASVVLHWRNNRFDGDQAMYDVVESWRSQDKHLCNWEGHGRSTSWRKEMYRLFALGLKRKYKKIVTHDTNWSELAKNSLPDSSKHDVQEAKWNSRLAAVGELSNILISYGADKHKSNNITQECFCCGVVNKFDAAKKVDHICDSCGKSWDQDANAARNLIVASDVAGEPRDVIAEKKVSFGITSAEWRRRGAENRTARSIAAKAAKELELAV